MRKTRIVGNIAGRCDDSTACRPVRRGLIAAGFAAGVQMAGWAKRGDFKLPAIRAIERMYAYVSPQAATAAQRTLQRQLLQAPKLCR